MQQGDTKPIPSCFVGRGEAGNFGVIHQPFLRACGLGLLCLLAWAGFARSAHALPGELDTTFDPAYSVNGPVYAIAQQADGKSLVGGAFFTVRGAPRNGIARLNPDGRVDRTFDPGLGVISEAVKFIGYPNPILSTNTSPGTVNSVALQSDGRILLGGNFTSFNGVNHQCIARLNQDGSGDTAFNANVIGGGRVYSVAVQPDGKSLVGGVFTNINGISRSGIARLTEDGDLDSLFDPGTGVSGAIYSVLLQPDGKILVGGSFSSVNGTNRNSVARLNSNGGLDATFDPGSGLEASPIQFIQSMVLHPDGKVLLAGNFTSFDGMPRYGIARLNSNGSVDETFDPAWQSNEAIYRASISSLFLNPDGKVLAVGQLEVRSDRSFIYTNCIARFGSNGSLDDTFNPEAGADGEVRVVLGQADGKVMLGGAFTEINGKDRSHVARLNANGSVDESYDAGGESGVPSPDVSCLVLQHDGKVLLGGASFYTDSFGQTHWDSIARLNADGSMDKGFDVGTGASGEMYAIAQQADGQVVLGGSFTSINGTNRIGIARLQSNGGLDETFDAGVITTTGNQPGIVSRLAMQSDGRVIVTGAFTNIQGRFRKGLARLHPDGSVDDQYDPGTLLIGGAGRLALQTDEKLLVAGHFFGVGGAASNRLARLTVTGAVDPTFNPDAAPDGISCIVVQPDEKILLGGAFSSGDKSIIRLNPDGTHDQTFHSELKVKSGLGLPSYVGSIALQSDGKLAVGGVFATVSNRFNLARLNADGSLDVSFNPGKKGPAGGVNNSSDVSSVVVQPDGRILIGGGFNTYNGVLRQRVARLLGDEAVLELQMGESGAILHWSNEAWFLQSSLSANGPFTDVPNASSPYTNSISKPEEFFRLRTD